MREKILHITQQFYVFLLLIVFATTNMSLGAIFMKKFSHYKTRKEIAKIIQQYENQQNECKCNAEKENNDETKTEEPQIDERAEKIEEQSNDEQVMKMLMDGDPMKTLSNKNEEKEEVINKKPAKKEFKKHETKKKEIEKIEKNEVKPEIQKYEPQKPVVEEKIQEIKVEERKENKKPKYIDNFEEETKPAQKKNFNLVKKNKNMQQIRKNNRTIEIIF